MDSIKSFRGTNRFLSNFWECRVTVSGKTAGSAEAHYQATKSCHMPEIEDILKMSPHQAKQAGKRIAYPRPNWKENRLRWMEEIVRAKFTQNPDLAELLKATGSAELIEGNYWGDTFWGVCNGVGENNLGKILMKIRTELASP